MFFDEKKIKDWEKQKPRNANGRFVKKGTPPEETAETTIKISGPIENLTKKADSFEEPLISFKINNPFKRVLYWLNDIRKKQTTTFSIQVKIPLMALPVIMVVLAGSFQTFFSLGKQAEKAEVIAKPSPTPVIIVQAPKEIVVSRAGVVKATYALISSPPIISVSPEASSSPTLIPTLAPSKFVLVGRNGQPAFLIGGQGVSFNNYLNKRVLATGFYDKEKNTLKIEKSTDIEVLP